MFRNTSDAAGEGGSFGPVACTTVGTIRTLFGPHGSAHVVRASGATVPVHVGLSVYRDDVIVTDADGAVGVTFEDGTSFCLGAETRMVVDEFICDSDGTLKSALFRFLQGTFNFLSGRTANSDRLTISTPFATIHGTARGGAGLVALTAFTFAIIREVQAASQKSAFLDDDRFPYEHLEAGTIEITTKEPVPRTITVNNPALTVVIRPAGTGGRTMLNKPQIALREWRNCRMPINRWPPYIRKVRAIRSSSSTGGRISTARRPALFDKSARRARKAYLSLEDCWTAGLRC